MTTMERETLAYLAGVLDSDGFITIKRSTYGMRVLDDRQNPGFSEWMGLKQTSPVAVDIFHAAFGGYRSVQKPSARNGKPLHSWQASNLQAATALCALLPFLRIKRRQAEIALELRALKDRGRKANSVRSLNAKVQNTRWGPRAVRRLIGSPEYIAECGRLLAEIRSLNDTRTHQTTLM